MSRFGQFHVAEPLHNLALVHRHAGEPLREVTHEPPLAVLDQQTLVAQGITTAQVVPGAAKGINALGSCTANATTAAISCLGDGRYRQYLDTVGPFIVQGDLFEDTLVGEEAAIAFYAKCTHQTGTTSTEWPPTDCGSSGPYIVEELERLGLITSQKIAHGAQDIVSLLQSTSVLIGGPWFNSWMTPGPGGFIDGNGTASDLEAAIASGVAGGHERLTFQVEKLVLTETDAVTAAKTILVDRNSWGGSWGDAGNYRYHLSTYVALGSYQDYRQLVA